MNMKRSSLERLSAGSPRQQLDDPKDKDVLVGSELVRVKSTRITIDLDPDDYNTLRDFGHEHRLRHADVVRAAVHLLRMEPAVGERLLLAHRQRSATQ